MSDSPSAFSRDAINQLPHETPYFLFDAETVRHNVDLYKTVLPEQTEICYAMKANSEADVLQVLHDYGSSFEVASTYELAMLQKLGVAPERILYGTAVKSESSIKDFYNYGVQRYAFDSEAELEKIARQAPGAQVYLRVLVNDQADSVFTMSEKFGITVDGAVDLLAKVPELGLQPYGISFNVGSQARNVDAWANGLRDVARIMEQLQARGITIAAVDLGGGFPYRYHDDETPTMADIGASITQAAQHLPYSVQFLAEPGRGLVADAYALVVGVFAKNARPTGQWLYVDAGAYNALLEAMSYQGSITYRIELLRDSDAPTEPYVLTGPTGDSLDVIDKQILLPSDVQVGDKLLIRDTGAYSFTLVTPFNGFPRPSVYEA
jgi:ornithine decarboxylase